jgi:hypothetical protein
MADSSNPKLTGITVSLSFGDKIYGTGSDSFMNASAKWSDIANPTLEDAVDQGLDLYLLTWKTLLAGRWATGVIDTETFKAQLAATTEKIEKSRKFLRRKANEQQQ